MASNSSVLIDIGQGLSIMVGTPRIASWSSKDRPKKAKRGAIGFNVQTNQIEFYDGEAWYSAALQQA